MSDLFADHEDQSSYLSIQLYKELLSFSRDVRDEFLKNVNKFDNQLKFNEINEHCYREMYSKINSGDDIPRVNDLEKKIEGLKELNKEARKFFIKKRNESVKGLDVQLGNKFDEILINFLNSKNIIAGRADKKNKRLPDIHILDKTRNIIGYIEHKYHHAPFMLSYKLIGRESYEGSITMDTKKLERQIIECESEIPNRPVYIVHWVDFHHLKGIFFNTLEQIKHYLKKGSEFNRRDRSGDYKLVKKVGYTEKFYPPLHEMGDFTELLKKLDKNGI